MLTPSQTAIVYVYCSLTCKQEIHIFVHHFIYLINKSMNEQFDILQIVIIDQAMSEVSFFSTFKFPQSITASVANEPKFSQISLKSNNKGNQKSLRQSD